MRMMFAVFVWARFIFVGGPICSSGLGPLLFHVLSRPIHMYLYLTVLFQVLIFFKKQWFSSKGNARFQWIAHCKAGTVQNIKYKKDQQGSKRIFKMCPNYSPSWYVYAGTLIVMRDSWISINSLLCGMFLAPFKAACLSSHFSICSIHIIWKFDFLKLSCFLSRAPLATNARNVVSKLWTPNPPALKVPEPERASLVVERSEWTNGFLVQFQLRGAFSNGAERRKVRRLC